MLHKKHPFFVRKTHSFRQHQYSFGKLQQYGDSLYQGCTINNKNCQHHTRFFSTQLPFLHTFNTCIPKKK